MNEKKIEEILKNIGSEDVPADVQKIAEETSAQFSKTLMQSRQPTLWSIIMKSPITKLAAAAVIIIAAFFAANQFLSGTVTFAQVIQPILNAHTVVFDSIMGKDETGPVVHDIVVGNRIRRTLSNIDAIMVLDLDNSKMLSLDPKSKSAMYIDIQGMIQEGTKNLLGLVRDIVSKIESNPNMPVQELGEKEIDGQKAVGFLVRRPNEEITIWASLVTAKPVRIELLFGQLSATIKNIEFDVPVDESLVSMEPPAGYTLSDQEFNANQFTEQDFVESLRIWAEILDGRFPENLSPEDFLKTVPMLGEYFKQSKTSKEEGSRMGMTFGRGLMFFQVTAVNDCDLHYAGKGVKLGDAEKAIFWYRPKGSKTYRVIYGDLSVEDVAPENLPK